MYRYYRERSHTAKRRINDPTREMVWIVGSSGVVSTTGFAYFAYRGKFFTFYRGFPAFRGLISETLSSTRMSSAGALARWVLHSFLFLELSSVRLELLFSKGLHDLVKILLQSVRH